MSNNLLTLDPGKHVCGVAWFEEGKLVKADPIWAVSEHSDGLDLWVDMSYTIEEWIDSHLPFELAYEKMVVKKKGKWGEIKADGLLELTGMTGALGGKLSSQIESSTGYPPSKWGRGFKTDGKPIRNKIERALDEEEMEVLEYLRGTFSESDRSHPIAAIGVGLYHLRRI